jgi:hypothetical protein
VQPCAAVPGVESAAIDHLGLAHEPGFVYAFTIAFVGATLFMLVDEYERDGPVARLLKFLVLFVAGVAILHKLQPMFGVVLF